MSTFETLLIIILGVYTLGSLYFAISGRILNHKMKKERDQERKEDLERADKSMQWEDQLKALTTRMSQLATENERVVGENRKWQYAYNQIYNELSEYKKRFGEPDLNLGVVGDVIEDSKSHMKVSDKQDMEKQFGEES